MSLGHPVPSRQSGAIRDDLEIEPAGHTKGEELLHLIIKFFADNDKFLQIKRVCGRGASGQFAEAEIPRLQGELAAIRRKADRLKRKELLFGAF